MRLGISGRPNHECAEEWADKLVALGCRAAVLPCDYRADDKTIDAYVQACHDRDLLIAEVGAWCNPMDPDPQKAKANLERCKEQLRLADRIGARCCVNIAGSCGEIWDGGYVENYAPETRTRIIETTQEIIDAVNPTRTCYTLEPMPWMLPDSPESYLELLADMDRPAFGVHLDVVNMISSPERYFFNTRFIERCFELLGPHIRSCHVKDTLLERVLTFSVKETACGKGALDIRRYAQLVHETDPDLPFIIEHLRTEEEYAEAVRHVQQVAPEFLG
jgi:sugar phosphate isomerase/epimerase